MVRLAFLAGLLLGWLYIPNCWRPRYYGRRQAAFRCREEVGDLLLYITAASCFAGASASSFSTSPAITSPIRKDIVAVWKGGMAFHGALVGCAIAIWAFDTPL